MILFSSALELKEIKIIIMKNLIVDATKDKIFLTLIVNKNIYTCSHENSKINFEKLMILINDFLKKNFFSLDKIDVIYTVHPLEGENDIFEGMISKECYSTKRLNEILTVQKLTNCSELISFNNWKNNII